MSIRCPHCKREYDVTLFEFGKDIICECGYRLGLKHEEIFNQVEEICRQYDLKLEEKKISEIQRASDEIASLILNTDYQQIDIEIEKEKFRELIRKLVPEKIHLYDLIYEPRFKRLWQQFRETEEEE
ncbi:MAG: hypothetical protein KAS46_01540 [Candidatus Aureabacteria bacterium]|nr:hypothetical protein [Candidatus Auribacterota bacterium]